jgi:mRNA interferase HigB
MKVRLLRPDTVEEFAEDHANGASLFKGWLKTIREADWDEPNDIRLSTKSNLLGNGSTRVVFDIGGNGPNSYRIICEYLFGCQYKNSVKKVHLYVNWIGTHEKYNDLTEQEKLTISRY